MANINYSDLNLKVNNELTLYKWNGKDIELKKYLNAEDKYDIVMITLQKAKENGYYNPIKLDIFFHLNLIYSYTNLIFTDSEREDEFKLYDEMKSNGFIAEFLKHINPDEYKEMMENIEEIAKVSIQYEISTASILRNFIEDLPANAEAAQQIVENFDPQKYQAVVDFAKAANGDREIPSK